MLNKSLAEVTKVSKMKVIEKEGGQPPPPKCTAFPPVYGYMYTSAPKAVGNRQPSSKRPLKKSDRGLIPGEYFNLVFDPRVYRGNNTQTFEETERNRCKKAAEQVERRDILKQRKAFKGAEYTLGGIIRPKTPQEKHRNSDRVATRLFLIEHEIPIDQNTQMVQTDDKQPAPVHEHLIFNSGFDVETQVEDWELFDEEEEIAVIAPILAEKIVEQSLQEVMEEAELLFARGVWATSHQNLHTVQNHLQVLRNNERDFNLKVAARRLELYEEAMGSQEVEELVGIICCSQSYLAQLPSNTLNTIMRTEGSLFDITYAALKAEFQPWLSMEVRKECKRYNITNLLINDMIVNVVKQRAAAVMGDLGLEIDFTGSLEYDDISLTHIYKKREMLMSDSNSSSAYNEDSEGADPDEYHLDVSN